MRAKQAAYRKRVEKFGLADRFVIQPTEDLHKTFGDPAPGCAKVLLDWGADIDAVSTATITMTSATRAIRNGARRIARRFLTPPESR